MNKFLIFLMALLLVAGSVWADAPAAAAEKVAPAPAAKAGVPEGIAGYESGKGFFIQDKEGNFRVDISGFIQMGIGIFENDTFENNSFYPNGVYLITDFYLWNEWHGHLEVDFAQNHQTFGGQGFGAPTARDAWMEWMKYNEFRFRVGNMRVPFTIEGQYAETQGMTIWGASFIGSWSHGRDPGVMLYGTLSDMLEYKLGIFNGDGSLVGNQSDDFLMAASARIYFNGKSKDANSFFHVGFIRSYDEFNFGGARLFKPWGGQIYGNAGAEDNTLGWRTGVDVGFAFRHNLDTRSYVRMEGEFMYITWERAFQHNGGNALAYLYGQGIYFGITGLFNINGQDDGSGFIPALRYDYSFINNKESESRNNLANNDVPSQGAHVFTFGVGYAVNKNITFNFNWLIMELRDKTTFGGPKGPGKTDFNGDVEHAWFLQGTFAF